MSNKNYFYKDPDEDELKKQSAEAEPPAAPVTEYSAAASDDPAEYSQASTEQTATTDTQPVESEHSQPIVAQQKDDSLYVGGYKMPSYEERVWGSKAKEALEKYDGYTYEDFMASPQYQELQEQYTLAGEQSMEDTLGQVSARTGGIASTYATAAAQQSYDKYMRELFEVANQMYDAEREEIKAKYGLYDAEEDEDYERFLDSLNFAYDVAVYNDKNKTADTADTSQNPATDTTPELTPQQAQNIYNDANAAMAEQGINIPGMLTYEDWLKVKNDEGGVWQPHYGVTQIGYDIARNSNTYEEYVQSFMDYMNQNYTLTKAPDPDIAPDDTTQSTVRNKDGKGVRSGLDEYASQILIDGGSVEDVKEHYLSRETDEEEYKEAVQTATIIEKQIKNEKAFVDNLLSTKGIEAAFDYLRVASTASDIYYETIWFLRGYLNSRIESSGQNGSF